MEVQVNMSPLLQPTHLPERAERGNGSCAAERLESEASVSIPPTAGESSKSHPTGWLSALKARIRPLSLGFNFICIIVITILIVLITRPAKTYEPCPAGAPCPLAACPFDWIEFRGKCYYFSELEANWTESQKNCSALGASLAGIDLQREMDFLRLHRGSLDYWIGLNRERGQTWKWANGTDFNNWFPIAGEAECAYLSGSVVTSSRCSNIQRWICSKPAQKLAGEMK
ncbi:C-type lectin domain family 2 member A-like [Pelodiscus sinensis]|uniref:C-type lectin domain family 2 member A-like n=1 Tax=Pelodiscus sinensis TaxID=13735 RepID=UPI003F6D0F15